MNVDALLNLTKPNIIKGHGLGAELIVSLTSYPKRYGFLPFAIRSLMNQTVKPDRIILWLAKHDYRQITPEISSYERLGLQILPIDDDWRSYKKIIPTLMRYPDAYVITCDDDILFKPTLVEELIEYYKKAGGIIAQRAHIIQFNKDGTILPYAQWLKETPANNFYEANSPFVFPTSGGGTLYPPGCFDSKVLDIENALRLCPTADDIWLYFMGAMGGTNASLIGGRGFINLNPDAKDSLWSINSGGENDRQFVNLINEYGVPESLKLKMAQTCESLNGAGTIKLKNSKPMRTLNDHLGRIISQTGLYYEYDLIAFVLRFFLPRCVVDVGTNVGNHAVGFSGHPKYKVICFEPDAELAKIARENLEMNSIDYELHCHGLGKEEERLSFVRGSSENSGIGRFDRESNSSAQILVKKLDDCIDKGAHIDLIKIDVEGFELDVLLGAINTIRRTAPVLIVEHQNYHSYSQCKEVLQELGFFPINVFCATPTFVYINENAYGFPHLDRKNAWVDCWQAFSRKPFPAE